MDSDYDDDECRPLVIDESFDDNSSNHDYLNDSNDLNDSGFQSSVDSSAIDDDICVNKSKDKKSKNKINLPEPPNKPLIDLIEGLLPIYDYHLCITIRLTECLGRASRLFDKNLNNKLSALRYLECIRRTLQPLLISDMVKTELNQICADMRRAIKLFHDQQSPFIRLDDDDDPYDHLRKYPTKITLKRKRGNEYTIVRNHKIKLDNYRTNPYKNRGENLYVYYR